MGREMRAIATVASREWVMLRWGNLSSIQWERGKQTCPMRLVLVSKSGSCEPNTASPNTKGSAVERMRLTPAAAIKAWVRDMKPRNITPVIGRDGALLMSS